MLTARLFLLQRLTALIMAPLTLGHIAVMIVAIQDGLSAAEILSRTQGSVFWALFYGLFAVAVAIHAAIGLRVIAFETIRLRGPALEAFTWVAALGLGGLGLYAVRAVT